MEGGIFLCVDVDLGICNARMYTVTILLLIMVSQNHTDVEKI